MLLEGIVHDGAILLDGPATLPEGARVEIEVKTVTAQVRPASNHKPTLSERLLKHAGTVPDLPSDMAEQHDHYIHGTPKR